MRYRYERGILQHENNISFYHELFKKKTSQLVGKRSVKTFPIAFFVQN